MLEPEFRQRDAVGEAEDANVTNSRKKEQESQEGLSAVKR